MISLKLCLSLNTVSHQFIYQSAKGPDALPLAQPATVTEGADDTKSKKEKAAPEQKTEAKAEKDEKKDEVEKGAKDTLTALKGVVEKNGAELLKYLSSILHETPEDIKYAVNTYDLGRVDNPHRSPKDKKIMGKLIDAINRGDIKKELIFQGTADATPFKLEKVLKLPDSWHKDKADAFKEMMNSKITPAAISEFIGEHLDIINAYIACSGGNEARIDFLNKNEAAFCDAMGLFNIATAFQRSKQVKKDFPKAAPSGFDLHIDMANSGQRRFRTSGVYMGFNLVGRKPAPKKAPEVEKPYANSPEAIQEFDNAQAAFIKAAQEINSKYGIKLRFESQFKGDKQTDKGLDNWTKYYNSLAENVISKKGTLSTALARLSPEERTYIQRVSPSLGNTSEKAKAWPDGDTTFKLNYAETAEQMLLSIRSRVAEFPTLVAEKLSSMKKEIGVKDVLLFPNDVKNKLYNYDLLWKEIFVNKKIQKTINRARLELKEDKEGAAKLETLKDTYLYLNPDGDSAQEEGYNSRVKGITLDYTEEAGTYNPTKRFLNVGNMTDDLLDGIDEAYDKNKGKTPVKGSEKAGRQ